jgi:hypothetical protein
VNCETCKSFSLPEPGPYVVPGFGQCARMRDQRWRWVSPSFPCHFTPSRYEAKS